LLLIVLVGAILRLYRLDAQSFWEDEALSSIMAASSLTEIWGNAFASVHPPGYYSLLYLWRSMVCGTDLALRFPSALLGVLGIVLTYQLGRDIGDERLGLLAAGVTALAPYHLCYSQEARMYTLLYCLTCTVMLAYVRLWQGRGCVWWVVFVVAALAGLWTHFFAGFVVALLAGHFCLLWLWRKAGPCWLGFFIGNGVVALTFGVYWTRFLSQLDIVASETWRVPPSLNELVGLPLALIVFQFLSDVWQLVAFGLLMFLFIVVGLQVVRALWQRAPGADWLSLLSLLFLVPVITSFVVSQFWRLIFAPRLLIVVAPALYLLVAWSATHAREYRFNQLVLVLLLPLAMMGFYRWFFDTSSTKPPVRDAAYLVKESELADAPVMHATAASYKIFIHYASDLDHHLLSGSPLSLSPDEAYERMGGQLIDPAAYPVTAFGSSSFLSTPINSSWRSVTTLIFASTGNANGT